MDWAVIGTLATIVAATATAISTWLSWKKHQLEESERLRQFTPPLAGMALASEVGANYTKLRDLLVARKFKEANQETLRMMLWVVRKKKTGLLDTKDIENFPCQDLQTIDQLWVQYSNGKFGFSIQKQIYNKVGRNWYYFTKEIEWRAKDRLIFDTRANRGHLPALRIFSNITTLAFLNQWLSGFIILIGVVLIIYLSANFLFGSFWSVISFLLSYSAIPLIFMIFSKLKDRQQKITISILARRDL